MGAEEGAEALKRVQASEQRVRRLQILIALRKLYRNILRAQGLLSQPTPIYSSESHGPGECYQNTAPRHEGSTILLRCDVR